MGSASTRAVRRGPERVARRERERRSGAIRLLDSTELVRERTEHGIRMAGACMLLALLGGGAALVWPGFGGTTRLALALVSVITAAFYGLAWSLRWPGGATGSRRWPVWASLVEVSLATTVVCVLAVLERPTPVAAGAGTGAYFAAVAMAATRMRPGLVLLATLLALAQWAMVDLLLVLPGRLAAAPGWEWSLERYGWLAGVGVIAAGSALALVERARDVGARMERRLERELGRYVSTGVARAILRGQVHLGRPERRHVTVLFCDLRGFTFLCERERPEDVVEILQTFYQRAFKLVQRRGGTVNKILGDGLLALFNAPDDLAHHASAAADAARDIMDMVHRLRDRGGVWTHLAVGIGLDTGDLVVGPIGSRERAEYTAIGSPVNRAARLQSLAERESRRVILSEATRRALGGSRPVHVLGEVELKGFAGPEQVYYLPLARRRPSSAGGVDPRQADRALREPALASKGRRRQTGGGGDDGEISGVETTS